MPGSFTRNDPWLVGEARHEGRNVRHSRACTHKSVGIDAGIATSAFRSKADIEGPHVRVR